MDKIKKIAARLIISILVIGLLLIQIWFFGPIGILIFLAEIAFSGIIIWAATNV